MGRAATRYQVTFYLIFLNYHLAKRALMAALDNASRGTLVDPYLAEPKQCICCYSVAEHL